MTILEEINAEMQKRGNKKCPMHLYELVPCDLGYMLVDKPECPWWLSSVRMPVDYIMRKTLRRKDIERWLTDIRGLVETGMLMP
jgi:hypothetical protein